MDFEFDPSKSPKKSLIMIPLFVFVVLISRKVFYTLNNIQKSQKFADITWKFGDISKFRLY